jgi:hypothetical protein
VQSKNWSQRPRTPRSPALAGALRAESLDFAGTFSLETRLRLRSGPRPGNMAAAAPNVPTGQWMPQKSSAPNQAAKCGVGQLVMTLHTLRRDKPRLVSGWPLGGSGRLRDARLA